MTAEEHANYSNQWWQEHAQELAAERDAAVQQLREYEAEAVAARTERDVSDEASGTWATLLAEAQQERDAAVQAAERAKERAREAERTAAMFKYALQQIADGSVKKTASYIARAALAGNQT